MRTLALMMAVLGCTSSPSTCAGSACVVTGLSASDAQARGCEVLLADGDGKIDHLGFGDGVTGKWLRQGDKVAAAFVSKGDSPPSGVEVASSSGSFTITRSHCYGKSGQELAGVTVGR
jgi:hypothetical protein